jgi:hypothetical protein
MLARKIHRALKEQAIPLHYYEAPDHDHNEYYWQLRAPQAIRYLLGARTSKARTIELDVKLREPFDRTHAFTREEFAEHTSPEKLIQRLNKDLGLSIANLAQLNRSIMSKKLYKEVLEKFGILEQKIKSGHAAFHLDRLPLYQRCLLENIITLFRFHTNQELYKSNVPLFKRLLLELLYPDLCPKHLALTINPVVTTDNDLKFSLFDQAKFYLVKKGQVLQVSADLELPVPLFKDGNSFLAIVHELPGMSSPAVFRIKADLSVEREEDPNIILAVKKKIDLAKKG